MSSAAERWRAAFFGLCAALLCLAAVLFAGPNTPGSPSPERSPAARSPAPAHRGAALRAALRRAARQFLAAFFQYEVGQSGGGVRRALRETTTARFAASLMRQPPRLSARSSPSARLTRLSITVLPALPPRALVSGAARRGGSEEQFSFLFQVRGGAWLASGPGE